VSGSPIPRLITSTPAALLGLGVATEDDIENRRTHHDDEEDHDHDDFDSFVVPLQEIADPAALTALRDKLDAATKTRRDWKTFAKAVQVGTEDLTKNKEKFAGEDTTYQWIDLAEARSEGIMPIPYAAAK